MPGGDGTGPMGTGPMTGWGRGVCRTGCRGFRGGLGRGGIGRGGGAGWRWRDASAWARSADWNPAELSAADERAVLERQRGVLEEELRQTAARLEELKTAD